MRQYLTADDKKECPNCGSMMTLSLPEGGFITLDMMPPLYPYDWNCPHCHHEEDGAYGHSHEAKEINDFARSQNAAKRAAGWTPVTT